MGELEFRVMTFSKKLSQSCFFSLHFGVREDPLGAYLQKVFLRC